MAYASLHMPAVRAADRQCASLCIAAQLCLKLQQPEYMQAFIYSGQLRSLRKQFASLQIVAGLPVCCKLARCASLHIAQLAAHLRAETKQQVLPLSCLRQLSRFASLQICQGCRRQQQSSSKLATYRKLVAAPLRAVGLRCR